MKSSIFSRALRATLLGTLATSIHAQSPAASAPGAIQTLGCYKSSDPLVKENNDSFQTSGVCQEACTKNGHPVMATVGGTTCYCGDMLPALDQQVDPSKCDVKCAGFGTQTCGGIGYWQLYLTGLTGDVQVSPNSTSSTGASSATHAAETVVVTQPALTSPSGNGGGPSKVGIAVGVVVGVVAVAGIIGGAIFFMRQKRKREIEDEYKAQLAINSFVSGSKSGESKSTTDQRLDQSVFSARRESVGSIADERDFSRRILQVRNPDRGSTASFA